MERSLRRDIGLRQPNQQHTTKLQTRLRLATKTKTTPKTTTTIRYSSSLNQTLHYTNATTASALVQTAASRVSHDALILTATRPSYTSCFPVCLSRLRPFWENPLFFSTLFQHVCFPTQRQDHFGPSANRSERNTFFNSSFSIERIAFANQGATAETKREERCNRRQEKHRTHVHGISTIVSSTSLFFVDGVVTFSTVAFHRLFLTYFLDHPILDVTKEQDDMTTFESFLPRRLRDAARLPP